MNNVVHISEIRPILTSINDACRYVGGISRAKFYSDILPDIQTVMIGGRRMVLIDSLDRFIAVKTVETVR